MAQVATNYRKLDTGRQLAIHGKQRKKQQLFVFLKKLPLKIKYPSSIIQDVILALYYRKTLRRNLIDFKIFVQQLEELYEEKLEKKQKLNFINLQLCLLLYAVPNHHHQQQQQQQKEKTTFTSRKLKKYTIDIK